MTSRFRFLVPLAWVVAAAGACSSSSSQPPELGDCVRIGDASCGGPLTGGGGGGGPGGDSGASDGPTAEGSGTCGEAENALGTQNTTCVPCVESSCCGDDNACSAQGGAGGCLALVQCMIGCGASGTCQETCSSSASQLASQAYDDFSGCLAGQCPGCPVLPPLNTGDL